MSLKKHNGKKQPLKSVKNTTQGKKNHRIFFIVILILSVLLAFSTALPNMFTNWDDNVYIIENKLIKDLSLKNIANIFTSQVASNYHPLTILSYAIEYGIFKLNPTGYIVTNILFHVCNTILVFFFITRLAQNTTLAFITALLFGIHPMHVESVAWISERKDVLYIFFYLWSLIVYLKYINAEERKWKFYFQVIILFILSLLSKGMAVTLPIVLLLIDYFKERKITRVVIIEKVPFFVLSLVFGLVAVYAQKSTLATELKADYTIIERVLLVCYGLVMYLVKLVIPVNLAAFYPYPVKAEGSYPLLVYISPVIVLGLIGLLIRLRKSKIIILGSVFFIVTIGLVLQIIPVGNAIIAERYSYLSYIGLFFIVAYYIDQWLNNKSLPFYKYRLQFFIAYMLIGVFLIFQTRERCKVWSDSETLWSDVIEKQPSADIAYLNRGIVAASQGKVKEAYADFTSAIELNPSYTEAYNNRGLLKYNTNDIKGSIEDFNFAVKFKPEYFEAYSNRGVSYISLGNFNSAIKDFDTALALKPDYANIYSNRGNAYISIGQKELGLQDLQKAKELYILQGDKSGLQRTMQRIDQLTRL